MQESVDWPGAVTSDLRPEMAGRSAQGQRASVCRAGAGGSWSQGRGTVGAGAGNGARNEVWGVGHGLGQRTE